MKKTITLIFVLLLCWGLCACGNDSDLVDNQIKNDILGEWTFFEDHKSITFLENGTGIVDGVTFTWKYDEELKYYTVAMPTEEGISIFDTMIQKTMHPEITYITIRGERFYHMEKDNLKDCKVITVDLDDMSPIINEGDIILCNSIKNPKELSTGDIIAYWTILNGQRVVCASRIAGIYDGGSYLIFETMGNKINYTSILTVHESDILGEFVQVLISQ